MSDRTDRPTLPDDTHIGRVGLRVPDLDRAVEFYRDAVGLSVLERGGSIAELGADETVLLRIEAAAGAERGRNEAGLYHVAFRVPSRGALGDALERIRNGWQLDGAADHGVSEALYLRDPADNGVEIYADRPRSAWDRADDGGVRMVTDPIDLDDVATAAAGDDRAPPGTDVGHVHLEVTALEAFQRVYEDVLGFELRMAATGVRFVSAGGYHHHLAGNVWHRRTAPTGSAGLSWFEVVVPDPGTIGTIRSRAIDRDLAIEDADDGFELRDEDGIAVRIRPAR